MLKKFKCNKYNTDISIYNNWISYIKFLEYRIVSINFKNILDMLNKLTMNLLKIIICKYINKISMPHKLLLYYLWGMLIYMVHLEGLEPPTPGFEVQHSIQLSYRCKYYITIISNN